MKGKGGREGRRRGKGRRGKRRGRQGGRRGKGRGRQGGRRGKGRGMQEEGEKRGEGQGGRQREVPLSYKQQLGAAYQKVLPEMEGCLRAKFIHRVVPRYTHEPLKYIGQFLVIISEWC